MKIGKEGTRKIKASIANIALFLSIFVVLFPLALPTVSAAGDIWYVGSVVGPGENHTDSIEEAVEDLANDGDTVRVWPGTYYENPIEISSTITLESIEGRDVTTIDAQGTGTVITISASWVNVTGFTIKNGGGFYAYGIWLQSDDNTIWDCNITDNSKYGIYLNGSVGAHKNMISKNDIYKNGLDGLYLSKSDENIVKGNNITYNGRYGVYLYLNSGQNEIVGGNDINNNSGGIYMRLFSGENNVTGNNISYNGFGIRIHPDVKLGSPCDDNKIIGNNITHNDLDGIWMDHSRNNVIADNNVSYNGRAPTDDAGFGIYLDQGSDNNTVVNNTLLNNTNGGIYLRSNSNDNTIQDNTISSGTYGG